MGKNLLQKLKDSQEGIVVKEGGIEYREVELYKNEGLVDIKNSPGYVGSFNFVTVKLNENGRRFATINEDIHL